MQRGHAKLIRAMAGVGEFSNANHLHTLGEERREVQKYQEATNETKLKGLVGDLKVTDRRPIPSAKSTGAWLSVRITKVSGTVLSATEFRDFLCARYSVYPLNLQSHCNGCGTEFGVTHKLRYSICGLVIVCHNKNREKSSIYPDVPSPQHQYAPNP